MVRAETERVPKEHYPIVLCALRSALSDTATTHPRKIIGAIQCIGRPPQGESVTAADYQQPEVVVGGDCAIAVYPRGGMKVGVSR